MHFWEEWSWKIYVMNILTGVHDKDAGTVVFDGKKMKNISVNLRKRRDCVLYIQELNLFNDLKF